MSKVETRVSISLLLSGPTCAATVGRDAVPGRLASIRNGEKEKAATSCVFYPERPCVKLRR